MEAGSLDKLRHLAGTTVEAELARAPAGLEALAGARNLRVDGSRVRCAADADGLDGLLHALTGFGARSLVSQPPTLEELFLLVTTLVIGLLIALGLAGLRLPPAG